MTTPRIKTAVLAFGGMLLMLGLAYASVPLYRAFCEATGFNGSTRRAEAAPPPTHKALVNPTVVKVRFDSNTNALNWDFKAESTSVDVVVGKTAIAYFTVTNNETVPVTGRATYNVLPEEMGGHFMKLECFCFSDQSLSPGETKTFPMVFYIDPLMLEDIDTKKVRDITLSYTFFESMSASKQS